MKDKEKVQTTNIKNNGSENYSGKKSVLIRVRRFESFPVHHIKTGVTAPFFVINLICFSQFAMT